MDLTVLLGRDDDFSARFGDFRMKMVGVVTFVGDSGVRDEALDESVRKRDVVALAWRCDQPERIAECVAGGVDFCA